MSQEREGEGEVDSGDENSHSVHTVSRLFWPHGGSHDKKVRLHEHNGYIIIKLLRA